MSAIFGETLTFGQENGPEVRLVVFGDESYARYETQDGYTVVYDTDLGRFCYAAVVGGRFVSRGVSIDQAPPNIPRHLHEAETARQDRFVAMQAARTPPPDVPPLPDTFLTLGPNQGLLSGRRVNHGHVRGLTILVNFQDEVSTVTRADVDAMLNGEDFTANGNFCSVREYFRRMSAGKLDYTNLVVGPYRLSRKRSYYLSHLVVAEALDLAIADGVDLSQFDSLGEGIVDALSIMYAGQTQYLGQLWPHNAYLELHRGGVRTGFYMLTSMGRTSADLSIGTFCHENGHMLCRFPDMYDYGNRDGDGVESAGIGVYCLMGAGNHLNNGRTPSPVCAYLRDLAGWCDTVVDLGAGGTHEARHGDYGTVVRFRTTRPSEYFLVENRSKLDLDAHLPASGLAVYHCDTRGSNEWQEGSSTRHYQCALLQADGRLDLERNVNQGDGGDLFVAVAGTALSHATRPASVRWDGTESGLVLSSVGPPGRVITFRAGAAEPRPEPGQVIRGEAAPKLTIPDKNPAGVASVITLDQGGTIRRLRVNVAITHTYIGDLRVELISPAGRQILLHGQLGGSQDDLIAMYDSDAPASPLKSLIGQEGAGAWILRVADVVRLDSGTLNKWGVEVTT